MLSNTLRFRGKGDIGTNHVLSELIKSFQLKRPVSRSLTPRWNLAWVLLTLGKPPFEPLAQASMMNLTVKTAFLVEKKKKRKVFQVRTVEYKPELNTMLMREMTNGPVRSKVE